LETEYVKQEINMDANYALRLLRNDPINALKQCVFAVSAREGPKVGYPAAISINRLADSEKNIFEIVVRGQDDALAHQCYYFPYWRFDTGVGFCKVPYNSPPGTIVLTTAMTGCAFQVNVTDDNEALIFMHDKDSEAIALHGADVVREINDVYGAGTISNLDRRKFRVDDDQYYKGDLPCHYYFITVRLEGSPRVWAVYTSCVALPVPGNNKFRRAPIECNPNFVHRIF